MTICVQWPQLGPYHQARLKAAAAHARAQGGRIVALETATRQALYGWQTGAASAPFERVTVFPNQTLEALAPATIRQGIREALDRIQPDVVATNSYSMPDAQAALGWCLKHRTPTVLMTDSKADDAVRQGWREFPKRRLVAAYQSGLMAGQRAADYIARLGLPRERLWLGYDVVDNAHFEREDLAEPYSALQQLPGLNDPSPFFLASSRFIRRKNLPGLLQGYAQYRARTEQPWRLIVLGDGALRSEIEAVIARESLADHVVLAGFQTYDVLPHYYHRAQAFVHAAFGEQWGLVINEAMAAGCPILCSRTLGCVPDLITDGVHGLLFDPYAPSAIADAMVQCHHDPGARQRWATAAQAHIKQWGPRRFATSLWDAAQAARQGPSRHWLDRVGAAAVLWLIQQTARSATSYHAVEA